MAGSPEEGWKKIAFHVRSHRGVYNLSPPRLTHIEYGIVQATRNYLSTSRCRYVRYRIG